MMTVDFSNLYRQFQFPNNISNKLSEKAKLSISYQIIISKYHSCQAILSSAEQSFRYFKNEEYKAQQTNEKKTTSLRIKHEVACLVFQLLSKDNLDINMILTKDSDLTEEDKHLLKLSFDSINDKIRVLNVALGMPCFSNNKN